jgi:hypothetical protein
MTIEIRDASLEARIKSNFQPGTQFASSVISGIPQPYPSL